MGRGRKKGQGSDARTPDQCTHDEPHELELGEPEQARSGTAVATYPARGLAWRPMSDESRLDEAQAGRNRTLIADLRAHNAIAAPQQCSAAPAPEKERSS